MRLLTTLREEHALIERVVLSLHTFATKRAAGEVAPADGEVYVHFFRSYVGGHHHAQEEAVLFPALVEHTEVPAQPGPLEVLTQDHHMMAGLLTEVAPWLQGRECGEAEHAKKLSLCGELERALLLHIDAENDVLFPEAEARFRRACVKELPERWPDPEADDAAREAELLVLRHEPARLPDLLRHGRCTTCDAFGTRCAGVEREWTSDAEWAEMIDSVG